MTFALLSADWDKRSPEFPTEAILGPVGAPEALTGQLMFPAGGPRSLAARGRGRSTHQKSAGQQAGRAQEKMTSDEKNLHVAGRESVAQIQLLYSINEACRQLSVGRTWMYQQIAAGRIRVTKLGRRTLVPADELRRLAGEGMQ